MLHAIQSRILLEMPVYHCRLAFAPGLINTACAAALHVQEPEPDWGQRASEEWDTAKRQEELVHCWGLESPAAAESTQDQPSETPLWQIEQSVCTGAGARLGAAGARGVGRSNTPGGAGVLLALHPDERHVVRPLLHCLRQVVLLLLCRLCCLACQEELAHYSHCILMSSMLCAPRCAVQRLSCSYPGKPARQAAELLTSQESCRVCTSSAPRAVAQCGADCCALFSRLLYVQVRSLHSLQVQSHALSSDTGC